MFREDKQSVSISPLSQHETNCAEQPAESDPSRLILHVDADAFFASVEQVLHPELKGKAMIVGGNGRGVVLAATYEARTYGIHSGMPGYRAAKLCPHALFVKPQYGVYQEFSSRMFRIMESFSPCVEVTSIDEGYVDLTGTFRLHAAAPWEVAHRMLTRIRSALGINVSGGMAGSRTTAKMTTGLAKPNGFLYLEPGSERTVLGRLPVKSVPGVGRHAEKILLKNGIRTVNDLLASSRSFRRDLLGKWGERLLDPDRRGGLHSFGAESKEQRKSYSKNRTLPESTSDYAYVRHVAMELAEKLCDKLRSANKAACTVTFKVRYADFTERSRSVTGKMPLQGNSEIRACLDELIPATITRRTRIRQVGVKLSGITEPTFQDDLFDPDKHSRRHRDKAVDTIRNRFGFDAVLTGSRTRDSFFGVGT